MNFDELSKARYSVREFSNVPIKNSSLQKILDAAVAAPTAANRQPFHIYIIKSAEALKKVKECTPFHFNSALILLVCIDTDCAASVEVNSVDFGTVDGSIVAAHIMLAAADLGIGTTWVGYFDETRTRERFSLPDNQKPLAFLPLGYSSETCMPFPQHYERKHIKEVTTEL